MGKEGTKIKVKIAIGGLVLAALLSRLPISMAANVPYEFSLDLACYTSTKITFNYPYTNNHSISDIATIGQSIYKHEGGPTYLTFIAEDIDIYSFTVRLQYDNETMQNVTKNVLIGVWSGNEAMDGYTISSVAEIFVIRIRLSLTEQPTYPTPEEVSGAVVHKIEQDLVEQTQLVTDLVARVEILQYMSLVCIAVVVSISLSVAIVVLVMWRRKRV